MANINITKEEFAKWLETNKKVVIYKIDKTDDAYCNVCPLARYIQELDPIYLDAYVTLGEVFSNDFKTTWKLPEWTNEFIQNFDKVAGREDIYKDFKRKSMRGSQIFKVLNKTHKSLM